MLEKLNIQDPKTRKYLYHVIAALLALGAGYGLIELESVEMWLVLASTALGFGGVELAAKNVSAPEADDEDAL